MSTPDRILLVTAVEAEQRAILNGLSTTTTSFMVDVICGGVGPVAAATCTARHLALTNYIGVISIGIAGHYIDVPNETVCLANRIQLAEFGVQTMTGHFLPAETLGWGTSVYDVDGTLLHRCQTAIEQSATGYPLVVGPILTVQCATGTAETAHKRRTLYPDAVAEAMEGYGVAWAAHVAHVPALEIRTFSNAVGPRDPQQWRISEALRHLQAIVPALVQPEVWRC